MIYRREITGGTGYTSIYNDVFENAKLSYKAKGLLCYLLTKPKNWKLNPTDLQKRSKDGRDSVLAGIEELVKAGYIVKHLNRGKGGLFESSYDVYDYPQPIRENRNGKPVTDKNSDSGETNQNGKTVTENPEPSEAELTVTEKPEPFDGNGKTVTEKPQRFNRNGLTVTDNPTDSNNLIVITDIANTDLVNTEKINTANAVSLSEEPKEALKDRKKNKKNKAAAPNATELQDEIAALRAKMQAAGTPEEKQSLAKDVAALKQRIPVQYPHETPEFIEAWADWKEHQKAKQGKTYKNNLSEQQALVKLNNLSNGNQNTAIALIYNAIEKNWSGIYEVKENGKTLTTQQQQQADSESGGYAGFGRLLM